MIPSRILSGEIGGIQPVGSGSTGVPDLIRKTYCLEIALDRSEAESLPLFTPRG